MKPEAQIIDGQECELGRLKSACIGICVMEEGYCVGCNRTLEEIEMAGNSKED